MKKINLYTLGLLSLLIVGAGITFAEEAGSVSADVTIKNENSLKVPKPPIGEAIKDARGDFVEVKKGVIEDRKDMNKKIIEDRKTMNIEIRDNLKDLKGTTTEAKKALIDANKEKREDFRENASSTRKEFNEESRSKLKIERIKMSARIVYIRINANIVRLEKIAAKLDARIAKIKSAGGNTTEAEKFSLEAKNFVSNAKTNLVSIKTLSESTNPENNLDAIKKSGEDSKNNLKSAQESLNKAIRSLKGLKVEVNASTTVSVSGTI